MRSLWVLVAAGAAGAGGCIVAPAPRERVVVRETVDPYGNVIERDRVIEEEPPPPTRVEVIPVAPYPTAIWVRGYWFREPRHRWRWVPGHWR